MTNLVKPYINTELYTRITLYPHQMNNDIYINLKMNLKKKVEKKCNKYGYIEEVFKILKYEEGVIHPEEFSATAIFNIKYSAKICIPIEDTTIICKIDKMNKVLIMARSGPIIAIIKMTYIDESKFSFDNGILTLIKTNEQVKEGDHIKIIIQAKKFNTNDVDIGVLGYLVDLATPKEITEYFNDGEIVEKLEEKIPDDSDKSNYLEL